MPGTPALCDLPRNTGRRGCTAVYWTAHLAEFALGGRTRSHSARLRPSGGVALLSSTASGAVAFSHHTLLACTGSRPIFPCLFLPLEYDAPMATVFIVVFFCPAVRPPLRPCGMPSGGAKGSSSFPGKSHTVSPGVWQPVLAVFTGGGRTKTGSGAG